MTKKPPKILIDANDIAKKPKTLEVLNIVSEFPANPAIIAPTIITDDIALVTDIKGVWSDGVVFSSSSIYGFLAIILAAVNIFGGFLVTQRMLAMYKKKKKDK